MAFFWPKNQTFEIKNYRGVTEEWCKIRRKTELRFGKWHEEFGNFSPGHSKVSNLGLWWDPFFQSRKCMSLKFTEELCLDNEERYKIWRGIDFAVSKLTNFDPTTRESQKLHFNGLFFTKVYNAWAKKVQRSYVWWHWRLVENLKEIDLCSQNGHEEFGKVSQAEK